MNLPSAIASDPRPRPRGRAVRVLVSVVLVIILAAGGSWVWRTWISPPETEDLGDVVEVMQGPLTIDITQGGQVQNRDLVKVRSEVEGRTTIIKLVDEGNQVKKGDLLVELDASGLKDQKEQQLLTVDKAEAAWIRAREDNAVINSQAVSDVARAALDWEFAEIDLKKYLEGDYLQELLKAKSDITIAEQRQKRAADRLEWSTKLRKEEFISADEYEADRLDNVSTTLNLKLAVSKLEVLENYTRGRRVRELESDVKQTEAALIRARRKAHADVVQVRAELKSRESEFTRQKERLQKLAEQITNCRITAPVDGMVVYATTGQRSRRSSAEPLAEGVEVRERQELIHLPVSTKMMAEIKVPESSLKKVKVGQRVRLTVDAHKGKIYWGRLRKIGLLPDAQSWWSNPDLKVYNTSIYIDGDAGDLRAGMSCKAEVIVAQYEDAIYVPIQSVVRIAGEPVVFAVTDDGPKPQKVKIGMDNGRMVHILSGLSKGDKVLLAPPLGESVAPITAGAPPEPTDEDKPAADTKVQETPSLPFDPAKLDSMSREERRKLYESLTDEQRDALRRMRGGSGRGGPRGPRTPRGEPQGR